MTAKDKQPLWQQQIDEIMKNLPLKEENGEDTLVFKGIGFIITELKDLLSPEEVIGFMRLYHEEANEYSPEKRWRLFFEHMILELSQTYPVKETAILMFKAGQVFERNRMKLEEGGEED